MFGNGGTWRVDVKLPVTYVDCKSFICDLENVQKDLQHTNCHDVQATYHCAIQVSMRGSPVRYQWYGIWAAAGAATTMCVAKQRDGNAHVTCKCSNALFTPETNHAI